MNTSPHILILERDRIMADALTQQLVAKGYRVEHVSRADAAMERLQQHLARPSDGRIGVVILDQDTIGQHLEPLKQLHHDFPEVVAIVTSAFRKVESAVIAMRLGAADYLLKPIIERELFDAVERAMQRHLLLIEHELAQQDVGKPALGQAEMSSALKEAGGWTAMPLSEALKGPEREILLAALEANDWNRGETARQLDINRTTLYKKIRQHRLDEPG